MSDLELSSPCEMFSEVARMSDTTCRVMQTEDVGNVSVLVNSVFDTYIAPQYTPQGKSEFRKYTESEAFLERIDQGHFVIIAVREDVLIGMIEMRENNHVSLLFVAEAFQRQGVSRVLLEEATTHARSLGAELERITVNSSRYGVPVYEALGFRQTGPERTVNGIAFIPLAKRLEGA